MTYCIAELGHNHMGDPSIAAKMIRVASECGADAVKFQKRANRVLYAKSFYDSPYNSENAYGPTYGLHREALELSTDDLFFLKQVADEHNVDFVMTAFDRLSLDVCIGMGVKYVKIASGDATNTPLISEAAEKVPVILSTGGCGLEDVDRAVEAAGGNLACLMQCTASYPCPYPALDLRVLQTYRERYGCVVGASLHDNGIAMAVAAAALGASFIEKHFTLDRTQRGTDHAFSLEPQGLRKMVRDIRRFEEALGDGTKKVYPEEAEPIRKMSKSLYTSRALLKGHVLSEEDICIKSPGGGIPPYRLEEVLGSRLPTRLGAEQMIPSEVLALDHAQRAG